MTFTVVGDNGAVYRISPEDACMGGYGLRQLTDPTVSRLIFGGTLEECFEYVGTRELARAAAAE